MKLKEIRQEYGITIAKASDITGVPVRTYVRYEKDEYYGSIIKRKEMIRELQDAFEINENKGLLTVEKIQSLLMPIFEKYKDQIDFCYLFGSYAKGYATEISDVDLCVSTRLTGLKFVGFTEEIHLALCKNIDVMRFMDLKDNMDLIYEILKAGVKIYG